MPNLINAYSDSDIKFLISNYSNTKMSDLVSYLNRTPASIRNKASSIGLKRLLYGNNDQITLFDIWSEEMAYILGFISADGCVQSTGAISIGLSARDSEHLENIKNIMAPTYKLRFYSTKKNDKKYPACSLTFGSKYVYQKLISLGVHERKTKNFDMPKIAAGFERHFLRGYFDGDGSIYKINKKYSWQICILGTQSFLTSMNEIICKELNLSRRGPRECTGKGVWEIKYGAYDSFKICEWLYNPSELRLERKYNRYIEMFNDMIMLKENSPRWSQKDVEFLINNYSIMSTKNISIKLNKSIDCIYGMRGSLKKKGIILSKPLGHHEYPD